VGCGDDGGMKLAQLATVIAVALIPMPLRAQTCGGVQDLGTLGGGSQAHGISDAGDVVVGLSSTSAYRWTQVTGMVDLGLGGFRSQANGVSGDGLVVVGQAELTPGDGRVFRWTAAGGMQDLGMLPGFTDGAATAASFDGTVVVGGCLNTTSSPATFQAFRWTAATGMQPLGFSVATDVSADGSVVVGHSLTSQRAFRWTEMGAQDIGTLGGTTARANGVSADGEVVAGTSRTLTGEVRAFRWTAMVSMQDLGTLGGSRRVPTREVSQPTALLSLEIQRRVLGITTPSAGPRPEECRTSASEAVGYRRGRVYRSMELSSSAPTTRPEAAARFV